MNTVIAKKVEQTQKFLENGHRIPVTIVNAGSNVVVSVKTTEKDAYTAVQLGFGTRKRATMAQLGHAKKANLEKAPAVLREVRVSVDEVMPEVGTLISVADILKPGDIINVTGTSKGKGFAGGVKRHNFRGGPKTHGQSDRHRAPGSIGSGTTPGRVYKGKRMAGRMGNEKVTVTNLEVVAVADDMVYINGLIPGIITSIVTIEKTGESKKFVPLQTAIVGTQPEAVVDEEPAQTEEVVAETPVVTQEAPVEAVQEQAVVEEVVTPAVEKTEEPVVVEEGTQDGNK